jgi:hypothetical protein
MTTHDPINGGEDEREAVAALERFGTTLRSAAVWEQPPADLGDRVIARVAAQRAGDGHVGAPDTASATPVQLDAAASRRGRASWLWPALAAAAALVVAFAAGALLIDDDGGGQRSLELVASVELDATELGSGASAGGSVVDAGAGYAINLEVAGLAAAPEGAYYEGWLHNEDTGDWVSVGTFHMRDGDGRVVLWSGVPIADYRRLVVTAEREGATGGPGEAVLSGELIRT